MTYTGTTPSIAHRATGTAASSASSGNEILVNKPATAAQGDLLVAFVTTDRSTNITADGWTLTPSAVVDGGAHQLAVFKRTVGASDPASWTFYAGSAYT